MMARRGTNAGKQRILNAAGFSGDGRNMAALSRSRPRDAGWLAWNGDIKLKRNEGRYELVYGGIAQQQGQYGSQTPVSATDDGRKHMQRVCPGLAS